MTFPSSVLKTVPNSAFDAGKKAKERIPPLIPEKVVVRSGVPIPESTSGHGSKDRYGSLLARMKAGDMAEFASKRQANALQQAARKRGLKTTRRAIEGGKYGVWLLGA